MVQISRRLLLLHLAVHVVILGLAVVGVLKLIWPAGAPYPLAVALVFTLAWIGGFPAYGVWLESRNAPPLSFLRWSTVAVVLGTVIFVATKITH